MMDGEAEVTRSYRHLLLVSPQLIYRALGSYSGAISGDLTAQQSPDEISDDH